MLSPPRQSIGVGVRAAGRGLTDVFLCPPGSDDPKEEGFNRHTHTHRLDSSLTPQAQVQCNNMMRKESCSIDLDRI
jgi:hypothetical protein